MTIYRTYSDLELVALLSQGDDTAFETLYQRYWKKLLYFANQKTADLMEAENIVQDVFLSLWKRRAGLVLHSGLENYLIVSVKYRVIKLFDRERTRRLYKEQQQTEIDLLDDSTQEYLDFDELRQRLELLITKLPEKSALVYRMSKEEGMSHKQIAEELGLSEKAVNSKLVRAKQTLRKGLNLYLLSLFA